MSAEGLRMGCRWLRQNPYKNPLTNPTTQNAHAGSVALMMSYE